MAFTVATWNILATSYIRREYYPRTPPEVLDPKWRSPALARYAAALDADILCMQEVERPAFAALYEVLSGAGYQGEHVLKGHRRPDGCAVFFRTPDFRLDSSRRIEFADGSGHIAQLLTFDHAGRRLNILNTHLKWDAPHTAREQKMGYRQIVQALEALAQAGRSDGHIVCGDFNVTPDSDVVEALWAAGMDYAHREIVGIATCNSNRQAKLIDYLFFSGSLYAKPIRPEPVANDTMLPSFEQPSDHVPLLAQFDWV